jgi:hypothetical protein
MKISKHLEQAVEILNDKYNNEFRLTPINYRAQGQRWRRIGYDITHDARVLNIQIEPAQFRKGSIYEKDKYLVGIRGRNPDDTGFFYATSLQSIKAYIIEKFI